MKYLSPLVLAVLLASMTACSTDTAPSGTSEPSSTEAPAPAGTSDANADEELADDTTEEGELGEDGEAIEGEASEDETTDEGTEDGAEGEDGEAGEDANEDALAAETVSANSEQNTAEYSESVSYSYFDDAVFIGDSLTNQLGAYVGRVRNTDPSYMGGARFGGVGSYGINNALQPVSSGGPHHVYQGVTMNTADFIATRHAEAHISRAYIMLGTNDLNIFATIQDTLDAYDRYVNIILEKNPHLEIVLMTVLPVAQVFINNGSGRLGPDYIGQFNVALEEFCAERGFGFIDTNSPFHNGDGLLPSNLSSADGFHLTDEGYGILVDVLCANAGNAMPS